jgi:hypothetical protein
MRVKIKYGSSVLVKDMPECTTIGDLKADDGLRAALGYGDNVNATYCGVVLSDNVPAPAYTGDQEADPSSRGAIIMETACNVKAS